jgi:hypothetical protein
MPLNVYVNEKFRGVINIGVSSARLYFRAQPEASHQLFITSCNQLHPKAGATDNLGGGQTR